MVTAEIPLPSFAYQGDGLAMSLTTAASYDASCSQRFCVSENSMKGLVVLAGTAENDTNYIRSNFYSSPSAMVYNECGNVTIPLCSYLPDGKLHQQFKLIVGVTEGNILTTQVCDVSNVCQMGSFRTSMGFSVMSLNEELTFQIGANNEQTGDHPSVLLHSIEFYAEAVCVPHCVSGSCVGKDQCVCDPGWTGAICDIREFKFNQSVFIF